MGIKALLASGHGSMWALAGWFCDAFNKDINHCLYQNVMQR